MLPAGQSVCVGGWDWRLGKLAGRMVPALIELSSVASRRDLYIFGPNSQFKPHLCIEVDT